MQTNVEAIPARPADRPVRQYVPASAELDDLLAQETKPIVQHYIGLYSWWRKADGNSTPFVVVEKDTEWTLKGPLPKGVWILLAGDSNRQYRSYAAFCQAITSGLIINITYR